MSSSRPPRLFRTLALFGAALLPAGCEGASERLPAATPPLEPHGASAHEAAPSATTPRDEAGDPVAAASPTLSQAEDEANACECGGEAGAACTANGVMCCWANDPCCEPCC